MDNPNGITVARTTQNEGALHMACVKWVRHSGLAGTCAKPADYYLSGTGWAWCRDHLTAEELRSRDPEELREVVGIDRTEEPQSERPARGWWEE